MVWKQDLAKLKQQFKEEGEPKSKAPLPKPTPKPVVAVNLSIEEQDTLFLNAMGRRPSPQAHPKNKAPEALELETPTETRMLSSAPPVEDFQTAMGGLKGLKPLAPNIPIAETPLEPVAMLPPPPVELPLPVPPEEMVAPSLASGITFSASRILPERIQLAAGMAIEVDGTLDLRGHSTVDAMERFRERLQDGVFLGWRTFHVLFGNSDELGDAFQSFLASPEARVIARFAQAPIPMGGNQAWILYYTPPTH